MIWQEVKLYTSSVGAEMLAAELLRLGVAGWQQESARELRSYLQDEHSPFDYADASLREYIAGLGEDAVVLTLYLAEEEGREQTRQIMVGLQELVERPDAPWGELQILSRRRSSEEWEDNWKQYYNPFKVGSRLVVCPSWEDYQPKEGEQLLLIEPGGSFGTGQHQTTRLCLELLENNMEQNRQGHGISLLDLGCGTGILSIGGLLLGAARAVAVDIEQHASRAAAENAARNGLTEASYQTFWGDILADQALLDRIKACAAPLGYDMIVVNIVADVIIAMSPLFAGLLAAAGRIICSGIIDSRRDEVLAAMQAQGWRLLEEQTDRGWYAMAFAAQ